ncbi:MAG: MaoC family dehydratase [Gracilibacteraceae bacterium]|nr:MaoC family dehydratase [Gracilibacteraceae bacterium]
MYEKKTFDQFQVGDKATFSKTITEADVVNFAGICGDFNPLHMDAEYAKNTIFKQRIAHGALVNSFISSVGAMFVGLGAVYISQFSKFLAPVHIGDTITATMEVTELISEKNRLKNRTYVTNQEGKIVIDGEAVVMIPR